MVINYLLLFYSYNLKKIKTFDNIYGNLLLFLSSFNCKKIYTDIYYIKSDVLK